MMVSPTLAAPPKGGRPLSPMMAILFLSMLLVLFFVQFDISVQHFVPAELLYGGLPESDGVQAERCHAGQGSVFQRIDEYAGVIREIICHSRDPAGQDGCFQGKCFQ